MRGFKIFRNVVPEELIVEAYEFLHHNAQQQIKIHSFLNSQSNETNNSNTLASHDLNEDAKKLLSGHFPPKVRLSEPILNVVKSKNIHNIVEKVTNWRNLNAHMPPMARFVAPNNLNAKVPMHQDLKYNQHLDDFVTVWLPLVEIDEKCGGLRIGNDPQEMLETNGHEENNFWFKGVTAKSQSLFDCVPMSPGDALVFSKPQYMGR